MRRIFNIFMKEVNPNGFDPKRFKYSKLTNMYYSEITDMFNKWVSSTKTPSGIKRFNFKAHTTKHVIMKWV